MKLVINVPDYIKEQADDGKGEEFGIPLWLAYEIANGTPFTEKAGRCKDCKYFEYDSFEKINGMQLIVAHEICSKWADGCKTREDGYCFLFEPQESENKE